jgi:TRAP-type C4-dicarboxylate transport system substrate-binding protein
MSGGRGRRLLACAAALALAATAAPALTIKMGTLAPTGSPWDDALKQLVAQWAQISGGTVTVKLYAGGIAGDEPDMIRKMRIGQLQAAAITVSGLNAIWSGVKALSFPLFLRNDAELADVLGAMRPYFDQKIQDNGFKVVMYSPGGWVYFFSRAPIVTPDDLRRQKLWVWAGDPDEVRAWQSAGFHVVPLPSTDIMTSLQSGMIDALVSSPLLAASNQWFGIAQNMADLKLGPLWGAVVVSNDVWSKIPPALAPKLADAAQRIADSLGPGLAKADQDAITVMQKYGLKINAVPPAAVQQWQEFVSKGFDQLIGKSFDRESLDLARTYLADYRSAHADR